MELRWLGDSCLHIHSTQATVVCDPYLGLVGASPLQADIATVSGGRWPAVPLHPLAPDCRPVRGPGEFELRGVYITGHALPPADRPVRNTVYLIEADGRAICHLGSLSTRPPERALRPVAAMDVLVVPVACAGPRSGSGADAMSTTETAELVSELEPRLVVPLFCAPATEHPALLARLCRELGLAMVEPRPALVLGSTPLPDGPAIAALTVAAPRAAP